MVTMRRRWLSTYGLAGLFAVVALIASVLLWPLLFRYPLLFFWPAVILSVWYAGLRTGLLVILLAAIAASIFNTDFFRIPADMLDFIGLILFIPLATGTAWFVARSRTKETALLENERRLRMMVDSVPGGVWTAKPDGTVNFANQYWQQFAGLTAEQTAAEEWSSVLHPDDTDNTVRAWMKAIHEGKNFEITARNRRADGQWRWLLNRASPVRDEGGRITGWFGTSMDITDWKETQETLIHERELLQKIIDAIPVMIVTYKPDTQILKVNPEFERVTGWTNEAAQGVSLMEEIYPDPAYRDHVQGYMSAVQPGWHDVRMRRRDHRVVQTSWANIRLKDDTQVGIGIDTSVRKQTEERTHALQNMTAALSRALTPAEVAEAILNEGLSALGAAAGHLALLTENDTMLDTIQMVGYPADAIETWRRFPSNTTTTPMAACIWTKEPIWLKSVEERLAQYPVNTNMSGVKGFESRVAIPLIVNNRAIGAMGIAYTTIQPFNEEDRSFILILAQQCAQALERARLYEAEQQARATAEHKAMLLTHLQGLTGLLSQVLTREQIALIIANRSFELVGARAGTVWELSPDGSALDLIAEHGAAQLVAQFGQHISANLITPLTDAINNKQEDWLTLDDFVNRYPHLVQSMPQEIKTHMWGLLPLLGNRGVLGIIGYSFPEPRLLTDEEKDFMRTIARQCAQALERTQLYEDERTARATAELKAARLSHLQWLTDQLAEVITNQQIARIVADGSFELVDAHTGLIWEANKDGSALEFLAQYGASQAVIEAAKHLQASLNSPPTDVLKSKEEMWISFDEYIARYPELAPITQQITNTQSWGVLPLLGHDNLLGVMAFSFSRPTTLNDEEKDFVRAITQQCAQALERVRLYERVKADAAEEERKRLARDLHDAVNQTLYSATVIAESLPRLWERDPKRAMPYLEQVLVLNKAAMAEMRTLLWELRPEALEKTTLEDLCKQLANAIRGRKRVEVALDFQVDYPEPLPLPVHVTFYRIAQEALNNVVKHSQAKNVTMMLISSLERVELRIADNGLGFDIQAISAGLGLGTMRERAEAVGAVFEMTSEKGDGTQVSVYWLRQRDPIPD